MMNLGAFLSRIGGMHALPVNGIRRGLENKCPGMPTHLWNMALPRASREVPGAPWADAALAEPPVRAWYPPPREPLSDETDQQRVPVCRSALPCIPNAALDKYTRPAVCGIRALGLIPAT